MIAFLSIKYFLIDLNEDNKGLYMEITFDYYACIVRGNALYAQGKYEDALKSFEEAIMVNPKFAVAWSSKSLVPLTLADMMRP